MAQATVHLPRLLETAIGNVRKVTVEGTDLAQAIEDLFRQFPALRVHLFDEGGRWRPHVLCFHNGESAIREGNRELVRSALNEGDEITILQAVSGG